MHLEWDGISQQMYPTRAFVPLQPLKAMRQALLQVSVWKHYGGTQRRTEKLQKVKVRENKKVALSKKHCKNRKNLPREHLGCRGVKLILLKYVTITTVTTATVTTVTVTTVTI